MAGDYGKGRGVIEFVMGVTEVRQSLHGPGCRRGESCRVGLALLDHRPDFVDLRDSQHT
jgi:hypothetical protein